MNETTTRTPAIDTIAEAARLSEYLHQMQRQAAKVEALAREAYTTQTDTASPYALARIAVLEAENATQREQIIRLTAALNYGAKPPEGSQSASDTI